MRLVSTLTICLTLATGIGNAQTATCPYADAIVKGSWRVLETRTELTGFAPRRVGIDAAYLALRYDDNADPAAVFAALHAGARPAQQADDLALTYSISQIGPTAALAGSADPVAAVVTGWFGVRRAVILSDVGVTYLAYMAQAQERADLDPVYTVEQVFGPQAAVLVMDQSDAFKMEFAQNAAEAGFPLLAAYLIADTSDRTAYTDFVATMTPDEAAFLNQMQPEFSGLSVMSGQGPVAPRDTELDAYRMVRSALYLQPSDFLGIFANQTGEMEAVFHAIDRLEAAAQAGEFDPRTDMDAAWIIAFDALAERLGPDQVANALSGFDLPQSRVRHFTGPLALGTLRDMAAAQRLGPYVAEDVAAIPAAHPHLPYPDGWVATAEALVNGSPILPQNMTIAAELSFAAGQIGRAMSLAETLPPADRSAVLTDFIKRLDRRCDGATVFPMQGIVFGGDYIWDFPQDP